MYSPCASCYYTWTTPCMWSYLRASPELTLEERQTSKLPHCKPDQLSVLNHSGMYHLIACERSATSETYAELASSRSFVASKHQQHPPSFADPKLFAIMMAGGANVGHHPANRTEAAQNAILTPQPSLTLPLRCLPPVTLTPVAVSHKAVLKSSVRAANGCCELR
eukprot:4812868-Amphidinium_carterae.1